LTAAITGTGNTADITGLTLLANGVQVATTGVTGTNAVFSFSGALSASSSVTYTVTANFGTNAGGTYGFSVTGGTGNNGQAVLFGGLPVTGATVTVVQATPTTTLSPTATRTSTPAGNTTVVVYPNPATGSEVSVLPPAYSGVENVKVQIFTTSFRMVQEEIFPNVPSGTSVTVPLKDRWGNPLANGLYYVVVIVDGHTSVGKLLVLR
jgi:hypothetical protein